VTKGSAKTPPLRLPANEYEALCRRVLERDGWRCQNCGRRDQLHVHHQVYRSQSGGDEEHNLITLCAHCHRAAHDRGTSMAERAVHAAMAQES
jgi:5-methylcytosine-specific restriction endonuclease McrA